MDAGMDTRMRETRLVKLVESLKRRLEQLKAENEELEELLRQADVNAKGDSITFSCTSVPQGECQDCMTLQSSTTTPPPHRGEDWREGRGFKGTVL